MLHEFIYYTREKLKKKIYKFDSKCGRTNNVLILKSTVTFFTEKTKPTHVGGLQLEMVQSYIHPTRLTTSDGY